MSAKQAGPARVYIVRDNGELRIITVPPELEGLFLDKYEGRIITHSNSIAGVIERYSNLLNLLAAQE